MSKLRESPWSENPLINNNGNSNSFSVIVKKITNSPLPWFGLFALIVVFLTAQSYQAKQAAFEAETTALLAEQHFKDYTTTTDEYIEKLRFELASHGIKPPEKLK